MLDTNILRIIYCSRDLENLFIIRNLNLFALISVLPSHDEDLRCFRAYACLAMSSYEGRSLSEQLGSVS